MKSGILPLIDISLMFLYTVLENTIQLIFCWCTRPHLRTEVTQEQNILVIVGDILTNKQKCNIAYLLALLVFVLDSAINTNSMWREESVQEWSAC